MNNKIVLIGFFLILLASTSFAQELTKELDSITIRENRLSYSFRDNNRNVYLLTRTQIERLPVKSATELLSYISGVDLRQRGPSGVQADIGIDGSNFDQVLVLVNGIKLSDPQTGHHMLNLMVPLQAIERIEVLRGAAAKIYGVNALAGAINIITRKTEHNEVFMQTFAGSSFQNDTSTGKTYANYGIQVGAALAGKNQAHNISLSQDQGNGYRYNTAYNIQRIFYNNQIEISPTQTLAFTGGYIQNKFGASLFYAAPGDMESEETVQTALAGIKYTIALRPGIKLSPGISYRYNKDDYIYIRQNPGVYRNIHETGVVTGELHSSFDLKKGKLGAGIEVRQEQIVSNGLGKHQRNNVGMYAEYKHWFSPYLNIGMGVFANSNSDYGFQAFPGIDLGYHFTKHWKLFASASTGQRLPTYTDLYYVGPGNIGNAQLKPETATFTEAGVTYKNETWEVQTSVMYKQTQGFIDWVKENDMAPWQPLNFQDVQTTAATLRATWDLSRQYAFSDHLKLQLQAAYTYLDASLQKPEEKISKYAIDALRHQLITTASAVLYQKFHIQWHTRYQYRMSASDYTLMDARFSWKFKKGDVYADINNLLDTQYKEVGVIPMPGRWVTLGVRLQIGL